jgi:hypothetical protein
LRTTYHLAAQLAIRCISKASEAYKRDKSIQPTFKSEGAVVYDERVMNFKSLTTVSLPHRNVSADTHGCYQRTSGLALSQGCLLSRSDT